MWKATIGETCVFHLGLAFAATAMVRNFRAIMPAGTEYQNARGQHVLSGVFTKKLCDATGSLQFCGPTLMVPQINTAVP